MADINVERKEGSIWPWLIGLIVLLLLGWLLFSMLGDDQDDVTVTEPVTEEVAPAPVTTPETTSPEALPVTQITSDPAAWDGRTVSGEARVAEAAGDDGFWIEESGERMLVVTQDAGDEAAAAPPAQGEMVRLRNAMVHTDAGMLSTDVAQNTRDMAEGEDAFLMVESRNIESVIAGTTTAGAGTGGTAAGTTGGTGTGTLDY